MTRLSPCLRLVFVTCLLCAADATAQMAYQKPPKEVRDILDAPPPPLAEVSPAKDYLLLVQGVRYPPIADLAQPMLRLAGERINPRTNGPHHPPRFVGLTLVHLADGQERKIALPADAYLGLPVWSADGKSLAFTNTTSSAVELWVADAATATAHRLEGVRLNAVLGRPFHWMPDRRTLICQTVVANRGAPPVAPEAPTGPVIQESAGKPAPVRTFQDMLHNRHDEELFDFYATAQLVRVDSQTGQQTPVGGPAIFETVESSPDGTRLLVATLHHPYSYLHPADLFPKKVSVWDMEGKEVFQLADLPLAEQVPIEGVPTGPRHYTWRPTEPATLTWVEALDEGDPRKKVPYRDRVLLLRPPYQEQPIELARAPQRFRSLLWGEQGLALLTDYDRDRRWVRTIALDAEKPGQPGRVVWDRSMLDRYGDPGTPILRLLPNGHTILWQTGDTLYLTGQGASPQGNRPFLDRFHLTTGKSERLFRCDAQS
jgi:dipeptidyl aminopeptidase/acylaminoacyl peptidase